MATPSESVVPAASRVRFPNTSTEARARGTSSPLTYTCTLIRISVGRWGEGSEDNKGGGILEERRFGTDRGTVLGITSRHSYQ